MSSGGLGSEVCQLLSGRVVSRSAEVVAECLGPGEAEGVVSVSEVSERVFLLDRRLVSIICGANFRGLGEGAPVDVVDESGNE